MEIEIRSSGVDLMEALRAHLQRRMRFRFDRYAELIRKISVRLTEQPTARADGRQLCQIRAELNPSGEVFVREAATDLYRAIGGSIERLGSALRRLRSREHTSERGYDSIRKEAAFKKLRGTSGRRNARERRLLSQRGRSVRTRRLRS